MDRVASVTVNYATPELTLQAVAAALRDLESLGGKAIIVNQESGDHSLTRLQSAMDDHGWGDRVILLQSQQNTGFGAGNNMAFRHALEWDDPPAYFYLLNPDAKPDPNTIRTLVSFMDEHPRVGLAGSKLRGPDGQPRASAFRFPTVLAELESGLRIGAVSWLLDRWRVSGAAPSQTSGVDWVSGASMIIRREVFDTVGMFDETFFLYFEETELALRARRGGWSTFYVTECEAEHIGQASTQLKAPGRRRPVYWFDSRRHYLRKTQGWAGLWAANLAFVGSRIVYQAKRRLLGRVDADPPQLLADFIRHTLGRHTPGRPRRGL